MARIDEPTDGGIFASLELVSDLDSVTDVQSFQEKKFTHSDPIVAHETESKTFPAES